MGIKFFKKNKMDLDFPMASITVTDAVADDTGQDFVNFLRNRNNTSGWATTGSDDSANTEVLFDLGTPRDVNRIILVKHNFKNFTIQYFNELTLLYTNLPTPISVTNSTDETSYFEFSSVNARKFKLVIDSTQVANADKRLTQIIITEEIGELTAQPEVKPKVDRSRKVTKFLSGKVFITQSVPSFEVKLKMNGIVDAADLTLLETLFDTFEGFLVWICGGDIAQFDSVRIGYRLEDLFLVAPDGEYMPEYGESRWKFGVPINIGLQEIN